MFGFRTLKSLACELVAIDSTTPPDIKISRYIALFVKRNKKGDETITIGTAAAKNLVSEKGLAINSIKDFIRKGLCGS